MYVPMSQNKGSDGTIEVKLSDLLGNYDQPKDRLGHHGEVTLPKKAYQYNFSSL